MTKVLMTGAGAPGAPGIIRSLLTDPSVELTVCDADEHATGRFLAPSFVQVPRADDPSFIPALLNLTATLGTDVIFPLVTKELPLFAAAKEQFAQAGVKIIVSDAAQLNTANNKGLLYQHLQQHSVHVPAFEIVHTLEELRAAVAKLGYPGRAVCIKPTVSNGSRGFRILDEQKDQYELFFNHKPNNTYSTLDQVSTILKDRPFVEMLVSEYLPGAEYTVDCIASKGTCEVVLPRKRTRMLEGISVKGVFEQHEEIITYCREIIGTLKLDGPNGIQVKQDSKGIYQVLEINPRIQGTSVAAMGAGVNLSLLAVKHAMGKSVSADAKDVKWGTHFARYWNEAYYD
jgi:carbamoyl-phosphate synthase large subunit